jgi:hypothetical protein
MARKSLAGETMALVDRIRFNGDELDIMILSVFGLACDRICQLT